MTLLLQHCSSPYWHAVQSTEPASEYLPVRQPPSVTTPGTQRRHGTAGISEMKLCETHSTPDDASTVARILTFKGIPCVLPLSLPHLPRTLCSCPRPGPPCTCLSQHSTDTRIQSGHHHPDLITSACNTGMHVNLKLLLAHLPRRPCNRCFLPRRRTRQRTWRSRWCTRSQIRNCHPVALPRQRRSNHMRLLHPRRKPQRRLPCRPRTPCRTRRMRTRLLTVPSQPDQTTPHRQRASCLRRLDRALSHGQWADRSVRGIHLPCKQRF